MTLTKEKASVRNFGKRTRGRTRDDKDEQEGVPINGRRKNVRPQGGYSAEPGDVMGNNHRTRTKTKGLPENYEEDQERDSVVGRRRRTRRPQGGYGASLGERVWIIATERKRENPFKTTTLTKRFQIVFAGEKEDHWETTTSKKKVTRTAAILEREEDL
ncbi:hypothetical protein MRX96_030426 [Rhipicephalus microplus]